MKRNALIAAVAAVVVSAAAWAGPGTGFFGHGPGMRGGQGAGACMEQGLDALSLTAEQRERVAAVQADVSRRQLDLMAAMHEQRNHAFRQGAQDPAAQAAMAQLREQMFALMTERRERVEAILTPEQRAQWRPAWRGAPWRG